MRAHVRCDLFGKRGALVVHRQHDALDLQRRIEVLLHGFDRLQKLRQTFEREELRLQRHEHGVRCGERVDGEDVQRGRAIDQHVIVAGALLFRAERGERVAQAMLRAKRRHELGLDAREVRVGRDDEEARDFRWHHGARQRPVADENVIARDGAKLGADVEAGGGVALRVGVEHHDALADGRERGAEVDGGGRLADAALLVRDRQNPHWNLTLSAGEPRCEQRGRADRSRSPQRPPGTPHHFGRDRRRRAQRRCPRP